MKVMLLVACAALLAPSPPQDATGREWPEPGSPAMQTLDVQVNNEDFRGYITVSKTVMNRGGYFYRYVFLSGDEEPRSPLRNRLHVSYCLPLSMAHPAKLAKPPGKMFTVQPKAGKTWADVGSKDDLLIEY